jgi:hypothetical protein
MRYLVGKSKRSDKEFTREQRLVKENRQLKRELAHLKKQIARIDLDRFETVKQMCNDYQENERFRDSSEESISNLEEMKKTWSCNECSSGYLEIILYSKIGETYYFRKCISCNKRTVGQRYDSESVKGIIKK